MSEEIDKIEGICQDCMYLSQIMPIIKQSQRKIEQLEMTLRGTTHCFDEEEHKKLIEENKKLKIQLYSPDQLEFDCPKCGEKYLINYSREVYDLKQENKELNNILTEFEKWLEDEAKRKNSRWEQFHNQINTQELVLERLNAQIVFIDCCLKRIQELKKR